MTPNGNGNGKVPLSWLVGLLTTIAVGTIGVLYANVAAKAETAEKKAVTIEAQMDDVLRRLDRIEAKLDRAVIR
jgi:hypothetical protein